MVTWWSKETQSSTASKVLYANTKVETVLEYTLVEFSARQTGSPKDFLTRIYRFVVSQGVNTNMATYQDRHIKTRSPRGVGPYKYGKFRWPRITLNHKTEPDEVNGLPEASRTMNMFGVEQGFLRFVRNEG